MASAPYGVRLLVGAAVNAIEETRRLPQTILASPMTLVSTVAQAVMKMQQDLADLVIKGDAALEGLFPARDEQPEWATFDEDAAGPESSPNSSGDGGRRTAGRFALYSVAEDTDPPQAAKPAGSPKPKPVRKAARKAVPKAEPSAAVPVPAAAAALDYEALTLAQLRARMTSISVADLRALLAYEEAGRSRAPFVTLLANRITRATAK